MGIFFVFTAFFCPSDQYFLSLWPDVTNLSLCFVLILRVVIELAAHTNQSFPDTFHPEMFQNR